FRLGHLHHFYGQRERVGSMVEQGITRNFHFMELNVVVGVGQSDGRGIANEMDFMASRGKFHPQFGGDHARAAIGWVACYANFHLDPGKMPASSQMWHSQRRDKSPCGITIWRKSIKDNVEVDSESVAPLPPEC